MVYYVFILNKWDSQPFTLVYLILYYFTISYLLSVEDFFQPVVLVVLSQNMEKTPFV